MITLQYTPPRTFEHWVLTFFACNIDLQRAVIRTSMIFPSGVLHRWGRKAVARATCRFRCMGYDPMETEAQSQTKIKDFRMPWGRLRVREGRNPTLEHFPIRMDHIQRR